MKTAEKLGKPCIPKDLRQFNITTIIGRCVIASADRDACFERPIMNLMLNDGNTL